MAQDNPLEGLFASMTVGELAKKGGRTIAEIAVFALGGRSGQRPGAPDRSRAVSQPASAPAKPARSRGGAVDTRTAAGREAYEAAVHDVVTHAGGEVSAVEVRAAVGGTPAQARAALNRLIDEGKVKYKGKARGTRYWA